MWRDLNQKILSCSFGRLYFYNYTETIHPFSLCNYQCKLNFADGDMYYTNKDI